MPNRKYILSLWVANLAFIIKILNIIKLNIRNNIKIIYPTLPYIDTGPYTI